MADVVPTNDKRDNDVTSSDDEEPNRNMRVCRTMLANLRARSWFTWPSNDAIGVMILMILFVMAAFIASPPPNKGECPHQGDLCPAFAMTILVVIMALPLFTSTWSLRKRIEAFMVSREAMSQKQYDATMEKLVDDFMKS